MDYRHRSGFSEGFISKRKITLKTLSRFFSLATFLLTVAIACSQPAALPLKNTYSISNLDFPFLQISAKIFSESPVRIASGTFRVFENGAEISDVSVTEAHPRQYLVLLLDRSSSLEAVIGTIRSSACYLIEALPPEIKIEVISFASDSEINKEFTFDRDEIRRAINSIRSWGGTTLFDATFLACEQLYMYSGPDDMKTIILFTDGKDETPTCIPQMSIKTLPEVLVAAEKRNARIITLGMGEKIDEQVLKRMAKETRGWYLFAPSPNELIGAYGKLCERMRMERHYRISCTTPNAAFDESTRDLKIIYSCAETTEETVISYQVPKEKKARIKKADPVPAPQPPPSTFTMDISMPELASEPLPQGPSFLEEK